MQPAPCPEEEGEEEDDEEEEEEEGEEANRCISMNALAGCS
jgi:hypothetical protein